MSIEFRWVHDAALVWLTLTDPALWPWVAYDDAQPDDFVPPPHMAFFAALRGDAYLGLFGVEAISRRAVRGHIYLLPAARGQGAAVISEGLAWLKAQDALIESVVGETPSGNAKALAAIKAAGFVEIGRVKGAVYQQGEIQDLVISQHVF